LGTYVFKLPDVGEGIAEAEIVAWHVEVGQTVKEDQPLVDVMTEKATVEIGSPVTGKILSRKGEQGEIASVGDVLVTIATEEEATAKPSAQATSAAPAEPARKPTAPSPQERGPSIKPSPEERGQPPKPPPESRPTAAPAVRARAAALNIDLATLKGTGAEGQIRHADIDAVLLARQQDKSSSAASSRHEGIEEIEVIGLRRQIAQTMLEAKRKIPHFSYVEEVDVTALEALRSDLNENRTGGRPRLTLLPFLIRGLVKVLPDHPGINAHFDDEAAIIRRHAPVHVGIATQTKRGLLVPVVRHAEALDIYDIALEITRLSDLARAGKASREELSGSTITVTSLGALGGIAATPIIKPPEVAIVGVNKIAERPMVLGQAIVIRKMMNLSSSFDHRVVDGFDAASFIQALKGYLEAPARLLV
jgi:2-oxoisovalerate dehydrogenase E2 component (dihydrolipoyl transacylase)